MMRLVLACLCGVVLFGCRLAREPGGGQNVSGLASAVFRVGPEGAFRGFPDGSEIDIPEGALAGSALIGFRAVGDDNEALPLLPPGLKPVSAIYACTPHGQQFEKPVRITFPHQATDHLQALALRLDDAEDDAWDPVDLGHPGNKMTEVAALISIDHFSFYVIAEPIDPGAPGICGNGLLEAGEACDDGENTGEYGSCAPDCKSAAAFCGDGEVDMAAGEVCDPPSSCTPEMDCAMSSGCNGVRYEGSPDTCDGRCIEGEPVTMCRDDDGCCPDGCAADQDNDCAVCGNGELERGESCEQGSEQECPTDCDDGVRCTVDLLVNAGTCNAYCMYEAITELDDGDQCCPPDGTPENDADCTGMCGDNMVDAAAGETCEAGVGAGCPTSCDDENPCTLDVSSGSAGNCNLACTHAKITAAIDGDQCCPPGQTANTDSDCAAMCGNDEIEAGETCEPGVGVGCPVSCNDMNACTVDRLVGDPAMCNQRCSASAVREPVDGDGCCPVGADSTMDNDCSASCGNGVLEPGEMCEPSVGAGCASDCDDSDPCTIDNLSGSASNCTAVCTYQQVTEARSGDRCCPAGADRNSDTDCSPICGNGAIEGNEKCEPGVGAGCPVSCSDDNPCTTARLVGMPGSCNAECVFDPVIAPINGDRCCPDGANANNDSDCAPRCGNDEVESGERCDGNCPTTCNDGDPCTRDRLAGAARTCDAVCVFEPITAAIDGDQCCPDGANANSDSDCSASCGNGVREGNETCDGDCPTSCNDGQACTLDRLAGSAALCTARCVVEPIVEPSSGDGCCPTGANANNDADCAPRCGNNVLEPGEECEGSGCPSTCDDRNDCTVDSSSGSARSCDLVCNHEVITAAQTGDGCCPDGTVLTSADGDCPLICGDGVIDTAAGETCDPNVGAGCVTDCDDGVACTADRLAGSPAQCNTACFHDPITGMVQGDGCCPAGANANTDDDCGPVCGNGVLEDGEICDGSCPEVPSDCGDDACALYSVMNAGTCMATCVEAPRPANPEGPDGCCPEGANANQDADCQPECPNGVVEAGETCDGDCPTAAECSDMADECTLASFTGRSDICTSRCSLTSITAPNDRDGCCPPGATAQNDSDCVGCGNGVVEGAEICDGNCPTLDDCDDGDACTRDGLQGAADSCNAVCQSSPLPPSGEQEDGCCARGVANYEDIDCPAVCPNGFVEVGELCDPMAVGGCPASAADCPAVDDPCQVAVVANSGTCQAECRYRERTPNLETSDSCCPEGATASDDVDCRSCGDGVLQTELGELCDPQSPTAQCPTECPQDNDVCTVDRLVNAGTCQAQCVRVEIVEPIEGDGCCPSGMSANQDGDCKPVCGNGIVEVGETCEPKSAEQPCSAVSCANESCFVGSADTCDLRCADSDKCVSVCGDGVISGEETCDPRSNFQCPTEESCKERGGVYGEGVPGDPCTAVCVQLN